GLAACGPVASDEEMRPGAGGMDGGAMPDPTDDGVAFIAFQRDFEGFAAWTHFEIAGAGAVGGAGIAAVHLAGNRQIYVNHMPAHGQTQFAKGTIIVKTME